MSEQSYLGHKEKSLLFSWRQRGVIYHFENGAVIFTREGVARLNDGPPVNQEELCKALKHIPNRHSRAILEKLVEWSFAKAKQL